MHAPRTENVCPKDNDKVFNLPMNSEPHRHDDAIISLRQSRQEASLLLLIYISLHQHRPFRLQKSFIYKTRPHCFCACLTEIYQCTIVAYSLAAFGPHSSL